MPPSRFGEVLQGGVDGTGVQHDGAATEIDEVAGAAGGYRDRREYSWQRCRWSRIWLAPAVPVTSVSVLPSTGQRIAGGEAGGPCTDQPTRWCRTAARCRPAPTVEAAPPARFCGDAAEPRPSSASALPLPVIALRLAVSAGLQHETCRCRAGDRGCRCPSWVMASISLSRTVRDRKRSKPVPMPMVKPEAAEPALSSWTRSRR